MPPNLSAAARYIRCTDSSSEASTCTASPPTSLATFSAAARSTSATPTCAPSSATRAAVVRPSRLGGALDRRLRSLRAAVGDVLLDGACEQVRLLQHDAHVAGE